METMPECPECDKIVATQGKSQILSGFVDWLNSRGYTICATEETPGYPKEQQIPIRKSYEQLFAEYFEIDLDKCEQERRALLGTIRG